MTTTWRNASIFSHRIDRDPLRRPAYSWRAFDIALGMLGIGTVHRGLPDLPDLFDPSGVDILRRERRQPFVRPLVVGQEKLVAPLPGMVNIPERTYVAGLVLGVFEPVLAEGVVVAHLGSRQALLHAQAGHQLGKAVAIIGEPRFR